VEKEVIVEKEVVIEKEAAAPDYTEQFSALENLVNGYLAN